MKKLLILAAVVAIGYLIYRAVARKTPAKPIADGGSAVNPKPTDSVWSNTVISKGDRGPDVVLLQRALNTPPVSPMNFLLLDGDFGDKTEKELFALTCKKALTQTEFAQLLSQKNIT
jgi:hypothetical protein